MNISVGILICMSFNPVIFMSYELVIAENIYLQIFTEEKRYVGCLGRIMREREREKEIT